MENYESKSVDNLENIGYDEKIEKLNKLGLKSLESLSISKYNELEKHNPELWKNVFDIHDKLLNLVLSKDNKTDKQSLINQINDYKNQSEYDLTIRELIQEYKNNNDKVKIEEYLSLVTISNEIIKKTIKFGDFAWTEGNQTDVDSVE